MVRRILSFLAISAAIYGGIALGLILSQGARGDLGEGGLDFSAEIAKGGAWQAPELQVAMRDGMPLAVRDFPARRDGSPLLILVHGSGWHSMQFLELGERLRAFAHVAAPDLRGHGEHPQRRGDIDYIGQLEDDLADLISALRVEGQKVILAGHSSGGGLVVRFAGGPHGHLIDGAILMAPFLQYDAPTTRPNSGGWAVPLTRRIIGLSMLNTVGIRGLNGQTVIRFRLPLQVRQGPLGATATGAYSYRLNTSFAPRRAYLDDIAKLPPFLLLAGKADGAFLAAEYAPLMSAVSPNGTYELLDGVGHLALVNAPGTYSAIATFVRPFASE